MMNNVMTNAVSYPLMFKGDQIKMPVINEYVVTKVFLLRLVHWRKAIVQIVHSLCKFDQIIK